MDPRHAAQLVQLAKAKIVQMIVQARVAFPPAEPRTANKWFNLVTDDVTALKAQADEELRRSPTASLHIDVMVSTFSPPHRTLLERWTVAHGAAAIAATGGGGGSVGVSLASPAAFDSAATTSMHDRVAMLMRNLHARLRQLPTNTLVRATTQVTV